MKYVLQKGPLGSLRFSPPSEALPARFLRSLALSTLPSPCARGPGPAPCSIGLLPVRSSPVRIALPYCPRCRPSHHVPTLSHTDPVCSPGCLQSLQPAPPTEGGFSPAVCEKPQVQSARGLWSLRRHKRSGGTYPLACEASHRPSVCLPTRLSPTPRLPHLCPSPFFFARLVLRAHRRCRCAPALAFRPPPPSLLSSRSCLFTNRRIFDASIFGASRRKKVIPRTNIF